jgi:group I intron endonuclease
MSMARVHSVYVVTHVASGKVYVGKTSVGPATRWRKHVGDAKAGRRRCPAFHGALAKYGADAFRWEVVASFDTEGAALAEEARLIAALRSTDRGRGYNVFADGTGGVGHTVSGATRAKLRAASLGKTYSAETRKKLSDMRRGVKRPPRDPEWSRKISEARKREISAGTRVPRFFKGQVLSPEERAKRRRPKTLTDAQRSAASARASALFGRLWAEGRMRPAPVRRGESSSSAKLTAEGVRKIREQARNGIRQADIAEEYGIGQAQVSRIVGRTRWAHIA